jgi:hypothetical protein
VRDERLAELHRIHQPAEVRRLVTSAEGIELVRHDVA